MDVRAEMTISKQEVTQPLTRNIPYHKQEVNKKIKMFTIIIHILIVVLSSSYRKVAFCTV